MSGDPEIFEVEGYPVAVYPDGDWEVYDGDRDIMVYIPRAVPRDLIPLVMRVHEASWMVAYQSGEATGRQQIQGELARLLNLQPRASA